jgi:hypothetical protein
MSFFRSLKMTGFSGGREGSIQSPNLRGRVAPVKLEGALRISLRCVSGLTSPFDYFYPFRKSFVAAGVGVWVCGISREPGGGVRGRR